MKLLVLDRDGVINHDSDDFIKSADEWLPIDGSLEAIARLSRAGYTVVVTTNQSGIARGFFDTATLHEIHKKMQNAVSKAGGRIDVVYYCPHSHSDDCNCRKPRPGMLHSVMERLDTELNDTYVVGDSLRDLQAAMAVGAKPALVLTGKGQATQEASKGLEHVPVFDDLAAFTDFLLQEEVAQ